MKFTPLNSAVLLAAGAVFLAGCGESKPGAEATGAAGSAPVEITTASGTAMVYLRGGSFPMGSAKGNSDEAPEHKVSVGALLMDKYEVTGAQYVTAQMPNPSRWHDHPKNPVEQVRWRDAKQYCNERSLLEKLKPCYNEKTPGWDCDRVSPAHRGGVGIRLPRRDRRRLRIRQRGQAAPVCLVQRKRGAEDPSGGAEKAEPLGAPRPLRQCVRVVRGRV